MKSKLDVDEAFIRRAVDQAESNVLRMALYHATGDQSLLEYELVLEPVRRINRQANLAVAPQHLDELKEKVVRFLLETDLESFVEEVPSDSELRRLIEISLGREVTDEEYPNLRAISSFDDYPLFRGAWKGEEKPELPKGFKAVIIGTGYSGLTTAVHLGLLGIPYTVYERRPEIGGTWSVNRYPDVRVDTMSTTYQLGFVKKHQWTEWFARASEVRQYIEDVAKDYGMYERTKVNHEVTSLTWNEETKLWEIEGTADGKPFRDTANVVAAATGLFLNPKQLDIPGVERFQGRIVHTARWPEDEPVDFTGKNVVVIGNGSTGVQLLKAVAKDAAQVHAVVRTPQWVAPQDNYGKPLSDELNWLLKNMPYFWNWDRFIWSHPLANETRNLFVADPDWKAKGGHFSEANDALRQHLTDYIIEQCGDRQDLIEKLTPAYPPWARRLITDNDWYKTLREPHVELVMGGVESIDETGFTGTDGVRRDVDIIVSASGFSVTEYLLPIKVTGRNGKDLHEWWRSVPGGPQAFWSMTVPDFPNLFVLYGPNSQGGAGGSLLGTIQLWATYVANIIARMIEGGYTSFDVKKDVMAEHIKTLDGRTSQMIWMDPDSVDRNYYVHQGRVQAMNAWGLLEHWEAMTNPQLEQDYELTK